MEQTINRVTPEDCKVQLAGQGAGEFSIWNMIWVHDEEDPDMDGFRMAALGGSMGTLIEWQFVSNETDDSINLPRHLPHDKVLAALRDLLVEFARDFPTIPAGIPEGQHVPEGVPAIWLFAPTQDAEIEPKVRALLERLLAEERRQLQLANPSTQFDQSLPAEEAS